MNPHSCVVLHGMFLQEKWKKPPTINNFLMFLMMLVVCFYLLYIKLLIFGKKRWQRKVKIHTRIIFRTIIAKFRKGPQSNENDKDIED